MIILSVIAAIPPVVLISRKWLDQYAYKTEFTIYIVLIPFIVVFMISLFAISLKTVRASRTNPVESLRYE